MFFVATMRSQLKTCTMRAAAREKEEEGGRITK